MKEENKFIKELKEIKFSNFVFLFIAGIINSIGVTLFLAPASLYDSGISGTSMRRFAYKQLYSSTLFNYCLHRGS